jgi:pimeloyl-ACP methyl ester carboxylesterase
MTSSSGRKCKCFRLWAVVAAWLACSVPPSVATGEPSAGFTPSRCPFDTGPRGRVDCGHVTVLQDRAEPDGRRLRLAVAVLRSTGSMPASEPLVFLSGGPGEPILRHLSQLNGSRFFRAAREGRDLVFFDQRGTGISEPTFCEGLDRVLAYDGLVAPPRDELLDGQLRALSECRRKLAVDGIDVADFSSTSSAHDVRDILDALGYQRADLYGHSYGSRLALAVIPEHPEILRSVLLSAPIRPMFRSHRRSLGSRGRAGTCREHARRMTRAPPSSRNSRRSCTRCCGSWRNARSGSECH